MRKGFVAPGIALALLIISLVRPQTVLPQSGAANNQRAAPDVPVNVDGWEGRPVTAPVMGEKPARAPSHDISGIGTRVSIRSEHSAYSARVQFRTTASQNMNYPTRHWGGRR